MANDSNRVRRIDRRRLMNGLAAAGALAWAPRARAQEAPPVIEPMEGEPVQQAPIEPESDPATVIEGVQETGGELRYFAETGHNLDEPFLSAWLAAGGEEVLGRPLSEERFLQDTGVVEQYFEGIVLVNAPNSAGQWVTTGAPLGNVRTASAAPSSARSTVSGCSGAPACEFFVETGHTVAGEMAGFWYQYGGASVFGLPVSEAFERDGATVQVFQNAILRAAGGTVTTEPIVRDLIADAGLENDAAFLPAPPTLGTTTLVRASDGLRLRGGPSTDAEIIAVLEDNAEFIAVTGAEGPWVPGYADGYSGYAAAEYLAEPEELPSFVGGQWDPSVWQGIALSETNIRTEPTTASRIVTTVPYGELVRVSDWVKGEQVDGGTDTWAMLDDGTYMYERNVGRTGPVEPTPVPGDAPWEGKWIDCNLTQQLVIAYEGRTPVRVAVTTTGKPGWETPVGFFPINTRVENETMESGAIGAEEFYRLENVLYTQYFTDRGHALHYAWWKTPETIGRPGSHGCLNLLLDEAQFFWRWATIGTPVYCHY
ncbi:MAG: L,D-transpeptidase family protein [Chloroflexota bacterium]|nr:L,D-transpeptidase family protein [Chloroflexota bacterium]